MKVKLLFAALSVASTQLFAAEPTPAPSVKIYGMVSNEFFYNSRQNYESIDGVFMLFPKPVSLNTNGVDVNAISQSEMLSVDSRLGFDITGNPVLGAKTSGKIEADFAGTGTTYFLLRIRQAYAKFNWTNTELLVGQTWHPLCGSVIPTTCSANIGVPFQAFNRSPQLKIKQTLSSTLSASVAAVYQAQYLSQGPIGASNTYLKNANNPDVYLGIENKTASLTAGLGVEAKRIKPSNNTITSSSAVAYAQYTKSAFTIKAKALFGQNLSDQTMIGGYGVSKKLNNSDEYTNLNTGTGWLNLVYGTKIQYSVLAGWAQNFGTSEKLLNTANKYTVYGYGSDNASQVMVDNVLRIAPGISYNVSNLKLGVEYDYTQATYGTIISSGRVTKPYDIHNSRVVASINYSF